MSSPALPRCPKCGRSIAAWRLDHCVYCGTVFPADFKQGVPEPEALKWIERPDIPPDVAKTLEMMKIVPLDKEKRPRSAAAIVTLFSVPIFVVIFYLLYSLVRRYSPATAGLLLLGGAFFIGYLIWSAWKGPRDS